MCVCVCVCMRPMPSFGGEFGWPNFVVLICWGSPSTGPTPGLTRAGASRCGPAAVVGRGCYVFRRGKLIITK